MNIKNILSKIYKLFDFFKLNKSKFIISGFIGVLIAVSFLYLSFLTFSYKVYIDVYSNYAEQQSFVIQKVISININDIKDMQVCKKGSSFNEGNIQFDGLKTTGLNGLRYFPDSATFTTRIEFRGQSQKETEDCLNQVKKYLIEVDTIKVNSMTKDLIELHKVILNQLKTYENYRKIIEINYLSHKNKILNYDSMNIFLLYDVYEKGWVNLKKRQFELGNELSLKEHKYISFSSIQIKSINIIKTIVATIFGLILGFYFCFYILNKNFKIE